MEKIIRYNCSVFTTINLHSPRDIKKKKRDFEPSYFEGSRARPSELNSSIMSTRHPNRRQILSTKFMNF